MELTKEQTINTQELSLKQALSTLIDNDIDSLDSKTRDKVISFAKLNILKDKVIEQSKELQYDNTNLIDGFLLSLNNETTKKVYSHTLRNFLKVCTQNKLHFCTISKLDCHKFYANLKSEKSIITANTYIQYISAFFTYLMNVDVINSNPMLSIKKSKAIKVKTYRVPTTKDINYVMSTLDKDNFLYTCLLIMNTHGLRVGSFKNMKIANGIIKTVSKGKVVSIKTKLKVKQSIIEKINNIKPNTLTQRIKRLFKKCGLEFSSHSLRHKFSVELYQETKDINLVSKKLNHSNIAITSTYLNSLDLV